MRKALTRTNFYFPGLKNLYHGKVRDVYNIDDNFLIMVATDRISAFDVVLPRGIPYKGQVLNQISSDFLDATSDIVPNWKIASPDPNVTVGHFCEPIRVEMVIRGYLSGHVWRQYKDGKREICGIPLPDGMTENQKFPEPIITPTTKAEKGHDADISREEIIESKLVSPEELGIIEDYTRRIFEHGSRLADEKGLILVDSKYEFGRRSGIIYLIDEIHTPDSSRYFYKQGYQERLEKGEPQKQLSKEFVRQWLMQNGFHGKEGEEIPLMTDDFVRSVSNRYIELFETLTGKGFEKPETGDLENRIMENIISFLGGYNFG